jgi:glyoxylase-like metal-dependent hydrolase (beta-lactamase superfamily II)
MILNKSDVGIITISRWIFNCHIVVNNGRPFVVDPGIPSNARSAARYVSDVLRLPTSAIEFTAVTHGHTDHLSGAPEFISRTSAPLFLPATAKRYFAGETPVTPAITDISRIWPVLKDQPFELAALSDVVVSARKAGYDATGKWRCPNPVAGFLAEGDHLPHAEDWQVLHTPGHTDDSTSYYHPETRSLLSGDAVLTVGGRAWFNPENGDPQASSETEQRLRGLRVDHLFPGHGAPISGTDVLADAISFQSKP